MIPESPSEAQSSMITTAGGPVCVVDEGEGFPLLAIHGVPGSIRDFRWLASCLEGPIRLIRFDMPGFANTPRKTGKGLSFAERADFVLSLADALELERFAVLGHSMGGGIAMHVASRHPSRVAGLALLASIGLRLHRGLRKSPHLNTFSYAFQYIPGLRFILGPSLLKIFIQQGFSSKLTVKECIHSLHTIRALDYTSIQESIRTLDVPTFQSWAEDDRLIETLISTELGEALPDGVRMPFETGGHNIQKNQAVELGAALIEWMNTLQF